MYIKLKREPQSRTILSQHGHIHHLLHLWPSPLTSHLNQYIYQWWSDLRTTIPHTRGICTHTDGQSHFNIISLCKTVKSHIFAVRLWTTSICFEFWNVKLRTEIPRVKSLKFHILPFWKYHNYVWRRHEHKSCQKVHECSMYGQIHELTVYSEDILKRPITLLKVNMWRCACFMLI